MTRFLALSDAILLIRKKIKAVVLRTCFKSVTSGLSARNTERRNRSVHGVHEDFEQRVTLHPKGINNRVAQSLLKHVLSQRDYGFQ